MEINDTLFIIPARGGSKDLPRKNILPLAGKPLIYYTIDAARGVSGDENICVSTDDLEIKQVVEDYGMNVPFIRPPFLATDKAGSREVILHAINFYKVNLKKPYKKVCYLQPTSPLRKAHHILEAYSEWDEGIDMVVSVKESDANPYFNLFEESRSGYLLKSKDLKIYRRQDAPKVFKFNGAIYLINIKSLEKDTFFSLKRVKKYLMKKSESIDIDTKLDYILCEHLINDGYE
jgi:CMP-N,N'-diacetyllegionaminic acid synthase